MADLIERSEIVKVAQKSWDAWNLAMATADGQREINKIIKRQELCKAVEAVAKAAPAVDAVPVVRCQDCRYGRKKNLENPKEMVFSDLCLWCDLRCDAIFPDDYCSNGERKEAVSNG